MNCYALKSGVKSIFLQKISGAALQRTFQENKIRIFPVESSMLKTLLDSLRTQMKENNWNKRLRLSSFFPRPLRRILFQRVHRTFGSRLNFIVHNGLPSDLKTKKTWKKMGFRILTINESFQSLQTPESTIPESNMLTDLKWETKIQKNRDWLYSPIPKFIKRIVQILIVSPFLGTFTSIQVENKKNLEKIEHPAVLIFNHAGNYDGALIVKILPPHIRNRTIIALMAEHWDFIFRPLYWHAIGNFFPFARRGHGVRSSLEALSRFIDKGWFVLYAPEGEIPEDTGSLKFKPGIGYIAVEMALPIIPFKIEGYDGVFPVGKKMPCKHGNVTIKVGTPLTISKTVSYHEATNQIRRAMESL
jgi:1-acyl-sn-glycerol-3-phosphate acyltransferase